MPMASVFLSFFTLVLVVHARLNLARSECDSLLTVQKNRGPNGQRPVAAPAPSPTSPPHKHSKITKQKIGGWILGFLAGSLAAGGSGIVFSVLFKLISARFKRKDSGPAAIFCHPTPTNRADDLAFWVKQVDMASLEVIGRGGCGEVYKGEFPGGQSIAIKKIIIKPTDTEDTAELTQEDSELLNMKMRQIDSEIQIGGQIRHLNLLHLLAHASRPDCRYLVYEFMANGSLQDILDQVFRGTRELDWLERHRIVLGVAAGLEHLHMNHSPVIIHRDLKPANILLDDQMEARIADFGLAKVFADAETYVMTSDVVGTVGYIPPESQQTRILTDKYDIYSFGVLLGVLVMGKFPTDDFFQDTVEMSLVKWMRNVMASDEPNRAIDPVLVGNGFEEQMLLVLKIACFCTRDNPIERPNSEAVRSILLKVKH